MTPAQLSLLLYLETCVVDHQGKVDSRRINDEDHRQMLHWANTGFIQTGRIASQHCTQSEHTWVRLMPEAWVAAHRERQARAERAWEKRKWLTTEEKRQV